MFSWNLNLFSHVSPVVPAFLVHKRGLAVKHLDTLIR